MCRNFFTNAWQCHKFSLVVKFNANSIVDLEKNMLGSFKFLGFIISVQCDKCVFPCAELHIRGFALVSGNTGGHLLASINILVYYCKFSNLLLNFDVWVSFKSDQPDCFNLV
jgi:hypothetical protein